MFEKEAEEYVLENFSSDYYGEFEMEEITEYSAFQDGAEFGYNKANEWHDLKVDPNDLPKNNKSYWVYMDCQGNKIYRSIVWQGCWLGWNGIPLAWCEEPQFKESE